MEGMLCKGQVLEPAQGNKYKIVNLLGAGGQGEVYEVTSGRKHLALKWYFKTSATDSQRKILENLIEKGCPGKSFLWPQDLVSEDNSESFGYVMPLRGKEYRSIVDLMKRKADPTFENLCRAAFNLTRGYQMLHQAGYQYRDISFGNVFFNPDNGEVLICDNDNVSPNGFKDGGVYGTPRFMAPEIVLGKAKPSRNTDLFSLAVLLFYMFMLSHPLEGRKEAEIKCMDILAMNKLYGTEPIFILDPKDKSNRPVKGYHDNAIIYWNIYPTELRDLFEKSFTIGLREPAKRVTENQWLEIFTNMMSGIVICPKCGAEVFYDRTKESLGAAHTCWNCESVTKLPSKIQIGRNRILITYGAKIFSHHINGDYDMDTMVGEVVTNPSNPNIWGVKNNSKKNWTYVKANDSQVPIEPGKAATIAKGAKIDFGKVSSEFI